MGMFDTVRSSYPLGEEFQGELQTKDIDDYGGGTMSQYWISPTGQLFHINYAGTADFVTDPDNTHLLLSLRMVPNGNHGKVRPEWLTRSIRVYPTKWDGPWEEIPVANIFIVDGQVESVHKAKKLQ